MQSIKLPSELCVKLDKLNRNFLWRHTDNKKTVYLINWDTVYLPKKNGGLGIKRMKGMNQVLLAKAGWRLLGHDNGVNCSSTWRGIAFGAKLIAKGLKWRVGNGCRIRFWLDDWVPSISVLKDHATIALFDQCLLLTVGYYITNWEWNKWTQDGEFTTVKSAYGRHLADANLSPCAWKRIKNLKLPPRVQNFLWILLHGKILTYSQRVVSGLTDDASCSRCGSGIEDVNHLLECLLLFGKISREVSLPLQSPRLIINKLSSEWYEANLGASFKTTRPIMVALMPHCVGCIKLNVDGGCNSDSGVIYAGGIIRDHLRNWVRGFTMNRGVGNVLEAGG
ncbi:hypothetical protein Dsin_018510 [Dipteronia sinensis]|uniref:Reverse transcriptase zinc-binding domain-containing protein n=1 Tax=Dipteronia sinensis TaxID=43782 RepID=A0AAE0E365_9ROSI|nr:hypothetical protein Dsin_018510 [Dipteronia sinensis]